MSETIWTPERRQQAEATCKKWEGTKHVNRIAIHGIGIDCIQFLNEILIDTGIIPRRQFGGYDVDAGLFNVSDALAIGISGCMYLEEINEPEYGAIVVFTTGITSGHCGFIGEGHLWHAIAGYYVMKGKIELWRHRFKFIYRITKIGLRDEPTKFSNIS